MFTRTSNRLVKVVLLGAPLIVFGILLIILSLWVKTTPQVLMISGTSTSGKTTTITHFIKEHPKWVVEGWDLALLREQENLSKLQPIDDINVKKYLNKIIAQNTVAALQEGKSVILDIGNAEIMTQILIDHGVDENSITVVLLYVPPSIYLDRLEKRNKDAIESGNLIEAREPLDMFTQYPEFYKVAKNPQLKLEFLTGDTLRALLEDAYTSSKNLLKALKATPEEMNYLEEEKTKDIEGTLHKLGFNNDCTEGFLTTRYQGYNLIINTGSSSPEEAARKIIDLKSGKADK